jgi:hypothetical protein
MQDSEMDLRTVHIAEARELLLRHLWKPALWGDLAGLSVADLLGIAHFSRRTGLLLVLSGGHQWALGFREGEIVLARSTCGDGEDPREVCFGLLHQAAGSFVFLRGPLYAFRGVEACGVQEILLEAA